MNIPGYIPALYLGNDLIYYPTFDLSNCNYRIYSNIPTAGLAFQPKKKGGIIGEAGLFFQCLDVQREGTVSQTKDS